jgi:hypothetical protein
VVLVPSRPSAARVPSALVIEVGARPSTLVIGVGAILVALAPLWPATGAAHPVTSRTENNRYVKLTVTEGRLRVAYSVLYGELPSFYARRSMDRDGDGQISPAEARAYADEVATRFAAASALTVNGTRVPLQLPDRAATVTDPRVGPLPFSVDMWEVVPLDRNRRHEVVFEAGGELPRLGETEVKFEETPHARLVAWCRHRPPCTTRAEEPRFVWLGPRASSMEDRSVSACYEAPVRGSRRRLVISLGAVALLLVAVAVAARLARRSRPA